MGWSLGDMLDKIISYNDTLEKFGYVQNKSGGIKPWSILWEKDNCSIEIRDSEWTYYENGKEIKVGFNPKPLEEYLLSRVGQYEI